MNSDQAPTTRGVYDCISDAVYHGDRNSLSSSGARKLLPPSCPAVFKHERDNPPDSNEDYDLGHAVHALVLGTGLEIVEVKATSWRTNDAKKQRADAYKAGKVPLLTAGVKKAHAMAEAVPRNAQARELLSEGRPEVSMYWTDPATWTRLRARPDWVIESGELMLVDLKTTKTADPQLFRSSASSIGYHQQAAWYIDGARDLLDQEPRFVFIALEKEEPYLVSVHEFTREDIEIGRRLNRLAIEIYTACAAENYWPGYGDYIHQMRLTSKARYFAEELLR